MSQTKAQLLDTLVASLLPASDSAVDIGSNAVRFANIYGDTLYGNGANLTGINTDLVSDTSPQLGGNLDVNTKNILFGDSASASDDRLIFGAGSDLSIYHDGTNNYIEGNNQKTIIRNTSNNIHIQAKSGEAGIDVLPDSYVKLYFDSSEKFVTTSTGVDITGKVVSDSAEIHGTSNGNEQLILSGADSPFIRFREGSTNKAFIQWNQGGFIDIHNSETSKNLRIGGQGAEVLDNIKFTAGDSQDLQIYHDGTYNRLAANAQIFLQNKAANESYLAAYENGQVELYYDNSKKFETTSTGANLYGHFLPDTTETHDLGSNAKKWSELHLKHYLYMPDSGRIRLGSSYNMQLFYDGSTQVLLGKTGDTVITCPSSQSVRLNKSSADNFLAESMLRAYADGAVELYHDNSKRFETSADGCIFSGPTNTTASIQIKGTEARSAEIRLIADDGDDFTDTVRLHQSINGNFYLQNLTASATFESMLVAAPNGAVELYHDNSKKLETTSTGIYVDGDIDGIPDGSKILVGTHDDIQIFHQTNASYIKASNHTIHLDSGTTSAIKIISGGSTTYGTMANFNTDGSVDLYHDGSKKFETISAGIRVTGDYVGDNDWIKVSKLTSYDTTKSPIQQNSKTYWYTRLDDANSIQSSEFRNLAGSGGNSNSFQSTIIPVDNMTRQSDAGSFSAYNSSTNTQATRTNMAGADDFNIATKGLSMGCLVRLENTGSNGSGIIFYGDGDTEDHFFSRYKYNGHGLMIGEDTNGSDNWTAAYPTSFFNDGEWRFVVMAVATNGTLMVSINGDRLTPVRLTGSVPTPDNAHFGIQGDTYNDNAARHRFATFWWYEGVISDALVAQEYAWLKTIWTSASGLT